MPIPLKKRKLCKTIGQLMIEYLLLYTAVVLAIIFFLGTKTSFFGRSYNATLERSANSIIVEVNRILK